MADDSTPVDLSFPPEAPQYLAWQVLGPEFVGFLVQIFVSGAAFQAATRCYSSESTLSKNMKRVLSVVLVLNALTTANTIWECLIWAASQDRSADAIWSFRIPDTYQPILAALISTIVQSFFAARAWRIVNRSLPFLILVGLLITTNLAGGIGLGVVQILNMDGTSSFTMLLIFTELYTWSAVAADLLISLVIIVGLLRKKTGYDMPTDSLVMWIVNAAFQSAALTTTFAMSAAIIYAIQWDMSSAAVDIAFLYSLPSLYTYSLLWCLTTTEKVRKEQISRSRVTGGGYSGTGGSGGYPTASRLDSIAGRHAIAAVGSHASAEPASDSQLERVDEEKEGGMFAWGRDVLNDTDFSDVVRAPEATFDNLGKKELRTNIAVKEREDSGSSLDSIETLTGAPKRKNMSFAEMLREDREQVGSMPG